MMLMEASGWRHYAEAEEDSDANCVNLSELQRAHALAARDACAHER
jgi:hypothetical protein